MNDVLIKAVRELAPVIRDATRDAAGATVALSAPEVQAKVIKEVSAVVVNQTNNEPPLQSRVTLGAIAVLIGATYTLGLDFYDGTPPTVDALTAQVGVIAGALFTLYGRWVAKKPLGQ